MSINKNIRLIKENSFNILMIVITILVCFVIIGILFGLIYKSLFVLKKQSIINTLFGSEWHPLKGKFGLFSFIYGTIFITVIASVLSIPVCILSAIYLSEYIKSKLKIIIYSAIDLLAGIPSVVYGIWGVLIIVPLVKKIAVFFGITTTGYCAFSGSIILAIMIAPIIIQISVEVLNTIPLELKEVSLALGATKWETIKNVVLKKALPGLIAAVILGISRALGETMAVLMVVGNVAKITVNFFDPVYPLTALIANNYGEMLSIPLYDSAIMMAAFILLIIVLIFNITSKLALIKIERNI